MTDITYNIQASSDAVLIKNLGHFIRHQRLIQNKSQAELAREAGIVRSTLSLFENGQNTSLLVFIQLLRSLKLLHMLSIFEVKQEISPIELAKLEQSKRIRAGRKTAGDKKLRKSDW